MLWCNGKQQNETMMLTSNYDNCLAGVADDVKAGAMNGNVIICKRNFKLKQPNLSNKSLLVWKIFLGSKGKRISSPVLF